MAKRLCSIIPYRSTVIGVSEPKLAATRAALREALNEADDRGTRFYIREALQHLATLERREDQDRDRGQNRDQDQDQDRDHDGTGGDGGIEDDGAVPVVSLGSPDDSTAGIDPDGLETADFPAHELDRN